MGLFILGVLVGWLAEWLFFTFWVKGDDKENSADCTSVRSELMAKLDAKNSEIATLKSELENKSATNTASVTSNSGQVTSKSKTQTKVATKTPTVKKAKATSTTAKKTTTKEKAPAKKVNPKKSVKASSGDDFTKLSGIGPSMAANLNELGITSFEKLAAMDDDILRDMLEESGARLNNNKDAMDSWNEQATLAAKGDFAGLKKLQEELKK